MQQKSIKKNTVYNAIKTLSAVIFPLITFPYISRVLLPVNVGKINFGLSIISYFTLIATLGITTYAIRECSAIKEDKEKLSIVSSQIFSINIITTIIAYFALVLTLIIYTKIKDYRLLIAIQSISIGATTLGADWLNSAMEDFKYITIRTVVLQIISFILMLIFVNKPEDYLRYAVISLISSAGASILNIWYRRRYCRVRFTKSLNWKKHITPIIFLFVMILAQNIYTNVDSTMLGIMRGDWDVGIYSSAHKIVHIISQVIVSIVWVIMPRASVYFANNDFELINNLVNKTLRFFTMLGLPCIVGVYFLADDIVFLAGGDEFAKSSIVLKILIIGFFFNLYGSSFLGNILLLPAKKEKQYMIICCITAVVNGITNYFLIPQYGTVGASLTTVFCNALMLVILIIKKDKRIVITGIKDTFLSPVIGSVTVGLICYLFSFVYELWIRVSFSIFVSIVVYSVIQHLFRNQLFDSTFSSVLSIIRKKIGKDG